MSFFSELKTRNVIRVAAAYLVVGWLVVQVVDVLSPLFDISTHFQRGTVLLLLVGFIPVMFFTWAYEITNDGIKKEADVDRSALSLSQTSRKLDMVTLLAVLAAAGMFAYQQMNPRTGVSASETPINPTDSVIQEQAITTDDIAIAPAPIVETNSIAVLPFVNMSSDQEQEYFADGISEEILNALVKANGLRVAGRTSSFSFKGKGNTIKQIAEALNVAHVLEGSVRKQGNRVRITAQLIKADDEFHLWSEAYDGTLDNIFDLQEEISRQITRELSVVLNLGKDERLATTLTANIDAYDLFLRGRENVGKRVEGTLEKGMELLQQAVTMDPDFAEAWAVLAEAEIVSSDYLILSAAEQSDSKKRAGQYARKAIALDDQLALPHAVLGMTNAVDGKILQAIGELKKALLLEPNNALSMRWLAGLYAVSGRNDLAKPLFEKAYRQNPMAAVDTYNLGASYSKSNDFFEAKRFFQITANLRGQVNNPDAAWMYVVDGEPATAKQMYYDFYGEVTAEDDPFISSGDAETFLDGLIEGTEEQKAAARTVFASTHNGGGDQYVSQLPEHIRLDDFDRAFEILEQKPAFFHSFAADYAWLPDIAMARFRADSRFTQLLITHGVPEVWQAIGWPKLCQPIAGVNGSDGAFSCR
ncbi:MAG: hypothetical protein AB8B96_21730 [Lysobacterales bacterium]